MTGSLRFRVTALAALAVLGVLAVVGAGVTLTHRAVLTSSLDETLGDRADVITGRLRRGEPVERRDLPTDDVAVQVVAADGTVLVASPGLTGGRRWTQTPGTTTVRDGELPDGAGPARVLAAPVDGSTIYVAGTLEDVNQSTRALLRSLLVAVPVSSAVLAGLIWWLVGRVLRPVEAMRAEVDRISASRLDRRVPVPTTTDEVARLAATMNAMLDRLARSSERQRRFVADAAHELRSPLARIRAELEVDTAHPSSADLATTHASVLAQTGVLHRLVDDLLLLARGDAGALAVQPRPLDLDDVVERAAEARRGSRPIDTRQVRPVQVRGDEAQLARAVGNLLDNAVRHARTGVAVTLDVAPPGTAALTVADDGPGIPAEAREAVFERFTRLDDARSADDGGAGLGLAIARDIARRHGGDLTVVDTGRRGAHFLLTLPVAREEEGRIGRSAAG